MKRRSIILLILAFLLLSLSGCGKEQKKQEQGQEQADTGAYNIVDVKKDGSVVNTIEEPFEREYYSEERLKALILGEVADYNQEAGESRVEVKKLSVKRNVVRLVMKFKTAEDFGAFNQHAFFYGTVADAYDAGYNVDITWKENGGDSTITKDDLLAMGSRKLIIAEGFQKEDITVKTSGKILYTGGAAQSDGKDTAIFPQQELSYLVCK